MPLLADRNEITIRPGETKKASFTFNSDIVETTLKQMSNHKNQIEELKKNLATLIDLLANNESLFSQLATFWGKFSWWQKALIGTAVVAPLLIISIVTHIAVLLAVSLCLSIAFLAECFLLENHHRSNHKNKDNLKESLGGIITIFDSVIHCLDHLSQDLTVEIEKLHQENETLAQSVETLQEHVGYLTSQVAGLSQIEEKLEATQEELEKTAELLAEKAALVEKYIIELKRLSEDAEQKNAELALQINKLEDVKQELETNLEQSNQVVDILKGSAETLSNTVIQDGEQRRDFQKRLEDFLNNKELTLECFATSLIAIEQELGLTQKALAANNVLYAALLDRQETQIQRLEDYNAKLTPALGKVGIFSNPENQDILDEIVNFSVPKQISC